MNVASPQVMFVKAKEEMFVASEEKNKQPSFSRLHDILKEQNFGITFLDSLSRQDQLENIDVLVAGIPEYLRQTLDPNIIERYLNNGGSLLLITNATTMINPPQDLNKVAAIAGIQFQEYLNVPAPTIKRFYPHFITTNVNQIKPYKVSSMILTNGAHSLADTEKPAETFLAYAHVGKGRIVAIGDEGWLKDDRLPDKDNQKLIGNVFTWLARRNRLELEEVELPERIPLGKSGKIIVKIRNCHETKRANFKCYLDSDAGALINEPSREKHGIPPGKSTSIQWQIQPQEIGEQQLRLIIEQEEGDAFYFDRLPGVHCDVSGYFTLEIKDNNGRSQTSFQRGEHFVVEGTFHSTAVPETLASYEYHLQLDGGLIQRSFEPGQGVSRWHLQAVDSGSQKVTIRLKRSEQLLTARVHIQNSLQDQINEIQAAMVAPLDAEIAYRLRQIDPLLSDNYIQDQPFTILSTDDYVTQLFSEEHAIRLKGMLASARREQWYNPDLLNIIFEHFLPTYVSNLGTFVPYDPDLASHLARLHPRSRRYLEGNLLSSNESSDVQTRQNVAAYLLHEKYGHGFFYAHTRLGQQLAILQRHDRHASLTELVADSSLIANEGFATWMELTLLDKLDREIRPSVSVRRDILIEKGSGLFDRALRSDYFDKFSPRFDSPYRQGFEYFDYISRTFHPGCAVQVLLMAANINLGISEDENGMLILTKSEEQIHELILGTKDPQWRANARLEAIANYLLDNEKAVLQKTKEQFCPHDCLGKNCSLQHYIGDKFNWR